jgi:hypothetical protein
MGGRAGIDCDPFAWNAALNGYNGRTMPFLPGRLIVAVLTGVAFLADAAEPALNQRPTASRIPPANMLIAPRERTLVQCGFVPFEGSRRLYACVVGTPAGVHYAYDFDTGALLQVWRGAFADLSGMWDGPGHEQTVRPAAPVTVVSGRPLLAFFPDRLFARPAAWPRSAEPLFVSHGYDLEPDGGPVFRSSLESLTLRDRLIPSRDGHGLLRRIELSGRLSPWETWLLLAEAKTIEPTSDCKGWRAAEPSWEIRWPENSPVQPVVRKETAGAQLVLRLAPEHLAHPIEFELQW